MPNKNVKPVKPVVLQLKWISLCTTNL